MRTANTFLDMIPVIATLDPSSIDLPLYSFQVPAGFPSLATDHMEKRLLLDELVVTTPLQLPPVR